MWIRHLTHALLLGECRWDVLFGRQGNNHWSLAESSFHLFVLSGCLNASVPAKHPKDKGHRQSKENSWEQAQPFPLIWKNLQVLVICLRVHNSKKYCWGGLGVLAVILHQITGGYCSMWLSLSHLLLRLQSLCSSKMKFPLGCLKRLKSTKQAGLDILSWGELCSQETPCNCTQPVLVFVLLQWCVSVF